MKIKPLVHLDPYFGVTQNKTRCEHCIEPHTSDSWHAGRRRDRYQDRDPMKCRRYAKLVVGGQKLCAIHAGEKILSYIQANQITEIK